MSDLLVGGRRPRASLLRPAAVLALVAVVGLVVAVVALRRVTRYPVPDVEVPRAPLVADGDGGLTWGKARLDHAGRIAVLRIAGTPAALGAAQGRLLGDAVEAAGVSFDAALARAVPAGGWIDALARATRVRWRYRLLDDGIAGHYLVEAFALARGAAASGARRAGYEAVVRRQAALDLGVAIARAPEAPTRALASSLTFVTPLRGPGGDRLLVGRAFSLPGADDGGDSIAAHVTVSLVRPDGAIPYASVGWPGLVGVVTGLNAEGIAVMLHPAQTADVRVTRRAQPTALIARDVLENARTLAEAIAILQQAEPLGAAAFVVVDGNARTWAVVERSPTRFAVRAGPAPPVVSDLLLGEPFAEDPANDRARRLRPSAARAARLAELLAAAPPSSPEAAAALLRDRRGAGGAPRPLGHRGVIDDLGAAHVALVDASSLVLWVADGGAAGKMHAFDLRHELRGEGARPAPPPAVAADASLDVDAAAAVVHARALLRTARMSDDDAVAGELVARALAEAPTYPAAHRLAGDLARRAGDQAAARRAYERYLELGGDDPAAEEEVRAYLAR